MPLNEMNFEKKDISGFLFQYPDTDGSIICQQKVIESAKKFGVSRINVLALILILLYLFSYFAKDYSSLCYGYTVVVFAQVSKRDRCRDSSW